MLVLNKFCISKIFPSMLFYRNVWKVLLFPSSLHYQFFILEICLTGHFTACNVDTVKEAHTIIQHVSAKIDYRWLNIMTDRECKMTLEELLKDNCQTIETCISSRKIMLSIRKIERETFGKKSIKQWREGWKLERLNK